MIQQESRLKLLITQVQKRFCVSVLWVVLREDMPTSVM